MLSVLDDISAEFQKMAASVSAEMAPEPAVGSPELADRSVLAGMSLDGMSGFEAGPGMNSPLNGMPVEVTQALTVNPATMPWTAQAEATAKLETPNGPGFGSTTA